MASFIAYVMSGFMFIGSLLFIVVAYQEQARLSKNGLRVALFLFVMFGFLSWAFAYLGGI